MVQRTIRYNEQLRTPAGARHLAYLRDERGFTDQTIQHFLLGAVVLPDVLDEDYAERISLPFLTQAGPVAMRFRAMPDMNTKAKYLQPKDSVTTIFNPNALIETDEWVAICEGEMDAVALWQCGIPAVGITGAQAWKNHYELLFEGYSKVWICADNDDKPNADGSRPGREFAKKIASMVPGPEVVLWPDGMDANEAMLKLGPAGVRDHLGVDRNWRSG